MKDETARGSLVRVRPWICGAALVLLAALAATPVHAFWYGESVRPGSDIIMMDLRWPFWAESTYYANWNCGIGGFAFYGGYNSTEPAVPPKFYPNMDPAVQDSIRPGSIWTFWGKNGATGEPVRTMATSRYNYLYQYVGEGASGAFYGGGWPIVRNKWYTMLIRVWKPTGPDAKKYNYIGRWTKDVEGKHWYLFGVAKLPTGGNPRFNGNSGFLEDFGNGCRSVRSIHRRRGYCRVNGQWHATHLNVLLAGKTSKGPFAWAYVPKYLDNGRAIAIENCGQVAKLPFQHKDEKVAQFGKNHSYPVKQPPKPMFDKLIVKDVTAWSNGRQVLVRWTVPPSSAPQLRYRVEVFDNPECAGKPVAMEEQSLPYIQRVLVDAAVRNPTVKLAVWDIFDNETKSVIVKAGVGAAPASAVSGRRMAPGLRYEYRTKDDSRHINVWLPKGGKSSACRGEKHYWVTLDELKNAKLVQQGISNGFDTSLRGKRNHGYGFRFRGFLKVPESGAYLFSVRGTDGYRLKIDKREALAWDGLHGPEYRFFSLNLAKGFHPISLDYFLDSKPPFLEVRWEGPGVLPQVVPSTALYHRADAKMPEVDFAVKQGKPGMVTVDADIDPKGRRIERIDIYHGTIKIASLHGKKAKARTSFTSFLPRGKEDVWLRLFYDGNHTIDSHKVELDIKPAPIKGWNLWVTGEKNLPYNIVQTAPNAFSFVGEGDYCLVRKVSGDFTMTAKIDSYMRSDEHPVNPSAWVGIRGLGPHSDHGLFQWADGRIRTTPDFPDVQGQRCGQGVYGSSPWLRIVRKGTLWSTWTSKDGKRWAPANSFVVPYAQNIRAGIMFSALPQDRSTYFSASISNVRVEAGVPDDIEIPSKTAEGTADVKMTGLAVAISDPNVVVVRTPGDGLLRSTDHGKTWAPANGGLSGAANCVRSVAIHPANPAIMFRAAGYADKNGSFVGGLYKTIDSGKTWIKLPFEGDFDGRGPSAICGEVVVINNGAPNEVLVGTETKGLFRSTDGGKTWKRILPGDQRFTTVKYNRFPDGRRREVYAITAFDRVMPILGRGKPAFRTTPQVSRIYKSDNSGANFALKSENPSRGFLNLAFFNFPGHELMLGTTHGFEYSCTSGATTFLFSGQPNLEHLRPITAIASSMDEGFSGIYSRSLMQAINPERINKLCIGGHHWFWPKSTTIRAPYKGVLKIEAADPGPKATGRQWWFLGLKGLYYTSDKCRTFARVTPKFARVIPKGPDIMIADFEGKAYGEGWKTEGNAFGSGPAKGRLPRQGTPTRYQGKALANSYHGYEQGTGKLVSPPFKIERKYINFMIGGGGFPGKTGIRLLVDGKEVRTTTAYARKNRLGHKVHTEILFWKHWDVTDLNGKKAVFEFFDYHVGGMGHILVDHIYQSNKIRQPDPLALLTRTMKITKNYVNIPTLRRSPRIMPMHMYVGGKFVHLLNMRIAPKEPDLWMSMDARRFKGKEVTFTVEPWMLPGKGGLRMLYQSDEMVHSKGLYDEKLRPQFHYSQRTGWNNDPNGMVYYDGEYHLFSQHDPHNWIGANGFWGHAVSRDLVHWEELPLALYPYPVAKQHCFSGSAVVDEKNVAGFQKGKEKTILAFFTDTGCGESISYSTDRGRTFTYYKGNPVVRHPGRDPKVIWYEPPGGGEGWWVMAVFDDARERGLNISFYTSKNLLKWKRESHIGVWFECPEIYKLPVRDAEGKPTKETKWVLSAADGQYAIGQFDGRKFVPEHKGKHKGFYGAYYAAQAFNHPPDGRRIQMGWARIEMPGMPFNQTFSFPHRLTLRQTPHGIRQFAEPVKEIKKLYKRTRTAKRKPLQDGKPFRIATAGHLFDVRAVFSVGSAAVVGLKMGGETIAYDVRAKRLPHHAPLAPKDGKVSIRVLLDRPMLEIIGNDGEQFVTSPRARPGKADISAIEAFARGGRAELLQLEVNELKSIWPGRP